MFLNFIMIRKKKKPTNKDLVYNIAENKRLIIDLNQKIILLESLINKYIEMKKDTKITFKIRQDW